MANVATSSATGNDHNTDGHTPMAPLPDPTGSRFSRRVRGMNDGVLYDPSVLELVEGRRKSGFKVSKSSHNENIETSPSKNTEDSEYSENNNRADSVTATTDVNTEHCKQTNGLAASEVTVEDNSDAVGDNKALSEQQQHSEEMEMDSVDKVKRSLEFDNTAESTNPRTEGIE